MTNIIFPIDDLEANWLNQVRSKIEKHLAGQHDQSSHGHGGHSTDRPYELNTSRRSDRDWGGKSYRPDPANARGPESMLLTEGGWGNYPTFASAKSIGQSAYANMALRASGQADGLGWQETETKINKSILNDPDYPKIPKDYLDKAMADKAWAREKLLDELEGMQSDEIRLHAMKLWAKENPDEAMAFLTKENKFVSDKMRAITFPNGQTVGEITDGVAKSLLDQVRDMAINNNVSLTMSAGRLKKFISEDHYKTASETRLSGKGAGREKYMERRDDFEFNKMGIPSNIPDSQRPVYGVLGRSSQEMTFGDCQVIFKDDVKHRTTATVGDSLDSFSSGVHWLDDYANEKISVADFWETHQDLLMGTMNNHYRSGTTYTWGKDDKGEPIWGRITGFTGKSDLREIAHYGYVETQIHGGLKLSDVATIVIPSSTSLPKSTQTMLADKGIEVIVGSHIEKSSHA